MQGGEGRPAVLTCHVHAVPKAGVVWYKNMLLLDGGARYHMHSAGNVHSLTIRDVGIEDFANYSCTADNSMGRNRATVMVTGENFVCLIFEKSVVVLAFVRNWS